MNRIALKTVNKTVKTVKTQTDFESGESNRFSLKPKQVKKKEFYVSDQTGKFFAGYRKGQTYWSDKIMEAKELTEESHYETLIRWEKGIRQLKKEFLD